MIESIRNHIVYYSNENNDDLNTECIDDHTKYSYSHCPVWKHRFDRTFVGVSPIDFSLVFDISKDQYGEIEKYLIHYKINGELNTINLFSYNEDFSNPFINFSISDVLLDNPVIQLSIQSYHFWTDFLEKDIWFEYLDYPLTSLKNNFVSIGGWFNISNHSRTTSLAIKVIDIKNSVVIKRGDPIFRVRFFSDNLNDKFKLIKRNFPEGHYKIHAEKMHVFSDDKKLLNSTLFGKSECPFHKYNKL